MNPKTIFIVTEPFEAARHVGVLPEGHRSRRLHGHSFLASIHCAMPRSIASYPGGELDTIKARLQPQIKKLDYSLLNDHIEVPTDENIARWINTHCYVPGTEAISVQSTTDEGLEIDNHGMAHVWRRFYFQAAHRLPHVALGHKCGNMHGHGFAVVLQASHHVGDGDLSVDYDLLDTHWKPIFELLDHACLNKIPGLENPTSELISQWIWNKLKQQFAELTTVTVYETASCGASYNGQDVQIWKEFTLDSSVISKHAPDGNKRQRLHGYTYTLRLHLSAPLDVVMGWAVDFGDVKDKFNPIFKQIDHKPLHEISDLRNTDVASLAHWILNKTIVEQPEIYRVDLFETKGCGTICYVGHKGPILPI
jgi:6-pyruvoyltetrahydropterin/6-carboxytetrahydropterin synthase